MLFHVYVVYVGKDGKENASLIYNFTEETVKQAIANPYMKNKAILLYGEFIQALDVRKINIFGSDKSVEELVLPNGKHVLDEKDKDYIVKCFRTGKVEGVGVSTWDFITSLPEEKEERTKTTEKQLEKTEVFIVHGRDEAQALRLRKYLNEKLKIKARMFEDFKEVSGSNTIIEQLEYIKDNVGYAFVIVTPDDLGCLSVDIEKCRTTMLIGKSRVTVKSVCEILDNLKTRARQNVVFEHGLFIGALGRDRVCCLFQEDTKEKPSDIDGILYEGFKKSVRETFPEIAEKLKKVNLIKT